MWVWSTCPWWNREVQITEFVKQWIPAQLHSEADASKDGQIRPHIRQPYLAGAGYENLAGFRPGPNMISGATLLFIWFCWFLPSCLWHHITETSLIRQPTTLDHTMLPAQYIRPTSFSVAGSSMWNSLPDNLRDLLVGSDSCRHYLKTVLFVT